MSFAAPSPRERELALAFVRERKMLEYGTVTATEFLLSGYREEVLREFVELQKDLDAMGDVKLAKALQEILDTARGVP